MIHIHSLQSSHQSIWLEYVDACSCWKEIEVFKPPPPPFSIVIGFIAKLLGKAKKIAIVPFTLSSS